MKNKETTIFYLFFLLFFLIFFSFPLFLLIYCELKKLRKIYLFTISFKFPDLSTNSATINSWK